MRFVRGLCIALGLLAPGWVSAQNPGPDYIHCTSANVQLSTGTAANIDSLLLAPGVYWQIQVFDTFIDSTAKKTLVQYGADTVSATYQVTSREGQTAFGGHSLGTDTASSVTNSYNSPAWIGFFTAPTKVYNIASATFTIGGVKAGTRSCILATVRH